MPLPSRQTLYRVNCRLFRVGYVRQRSGVIGPRTSLPDSAPLTPSPPRPPPPLPGTVDVRTPMVLDDVCTPVYRGVVVCVVCVCVCIGRGPIGRGVAASVVSRAGARARVSPFFLPLRRLSPRVLFGTASSFIRPCAVDVSSREIEFLACFTPALLSQIRSIDLSQYRRSAFLTTTIFPYDKLRLRYVARGATLTATRR